MKRTRILCLFLALPAVVHAVDNSYTNTASDKWETPSNWSLGAAPSTNQSTIFVTNATTKSVTIDATTAGNSAIMIVSNLLVQGPGASTNTLQLTDAGTNMPFRVLRTMVISTNAVLLVSNSVLQAEGGVLTTSNVVINGAVTVLASGVVTSGLPQVIVGRTPGPGATLTVGGGRFFSSGTFTVGLMANSTGTVWLTGNSGLLQSSAAMIIAGAGTGQLIVSNGTWIAGDATVGSSAGSRGIVTVAGGTNSLAKLTVGSGPGSTGEIWVTDGQLVVTTSTTVIGQNGVGQLTVSNGTVRTLGLSIGGAAGTLTVAGGTNLVTGSLTVNNGAVWLSSGALVVTNASSGFNDAQMTVSNGTFLGTALALPSATGKQATWTIAGGTNVLSNVLNIGGATDSTGTVWMTGGHLVVTNSSIIQLGLGGIGSLTVSNGSILGLTVVLNRGTFSLAGGTNNISSDLYIGNFAGSTGNVWMTGGMLTVTNVNSDVIIGRMAHGQLTMSNGTALVTNMFVGFFAGSRGTLTQAGGVMETHFLEIAPSLDAPGAVMILGGTNRVYRVLGIGQPNCAATGTVIVAGGSLFVTNASTNAVLAVRSGTFALNSGTVIVDRFVMTNACGFFSRTGGALIYGSAVLSSNRDDDVDGILNGYEQSHGLDPLNSADANVDSDGDGLSNLQEFLAGTDATNSASALRITSIAREANDIRVTWMTAPGKTNALDRTAGAAGSYATNFAAIFTVTNTVGTTTNYLDVGAATNFPARYYRVRLVP